MSINTQVNDAEKEEKDSFINADKDDADKDFCTKSQLRSMMTIQEFPGNNELLPRGRIETRIRKVLAETEKLDLATQSVCFTLIDWRQIC